MNWPPNQKLQPIEVQPYSDSDEDYEDVEFPIVPEKFGRRRTESDVIDVIGSLCLEGVFQGIAEEEEGQSSGMLPSSVRMTDNLVKQGDELDELSVMVTRNLEIVPETPFDANTGTGKSFSVLKAKMSRHSSKHPISSITLKNVMCIHAIITIPFFFSSQVASES